MTGSKSGILSRSDLIYIIVGIIVGSGIISLPGGMVRLAYQDGWIAAFLGVIYPIYIVIAAYIINKKHENETIMTVSTKYLGKYFGGILNLVFLLQFIIYGVLVTGSNTNMVKVYNIWFMKSSQIVLIFVLLSGYAAYNGLETLAKINRITFYIIILVVLASVSVFRVSKSLVNIKPIMQVDYMTLIKSSKESFFNYGNIEIVLIVSAYVKEKKYILKDSIFAVLLVSLIYTWVVFITTIYLGPDIVPKYLWPYVLTLQAVKISLFNDLKFFLGLLWIIINFKTVAGEIYCAVEIVESMNKKYDRKKVTIILSSFLFLALLFKNEVERRKIVDLIIPKITYFNILYTTLILILVKFNKVISFRRNNDGE